MKQLCALRIQAEIPPFPLSLSTTSSLLSLFPLPSPYPSLPACLPFHKLPFSKCFWFLVSKVCCTQKKELRHYSIPCRLTAEIVPALHRVCQANQLQLLFIYYCIYIEITFCLARNFTAQLLPQNVGQKSICQTNYKFTLISAKFCAAPPPPPASTLLLSLSLSARFRCCSSQITWQRAQAESA